ncbi:MAG: DNA mismatch repair endonuclease MutL [Elusimicrobiota bacterium]|jgi:DNA mismatch repair protein MutL
MGKIRLLPDEVASQVAAGEVVERPASVVKELVENSVDAGARRIVVEFARGGTQLIRVADDGCGMDREDALLSLERHATSKIRTAEDLARVTTMGFRGEAVPSIASVSRFRLVTRPPGAEAGTEIVIAGGKIESVSDSGEAPGTAIEVRALFFNLPARRKFLRGEETEAAHIIHQMESLAIAHPDVAMTLVRDGRRLWQAAATTDPGVRLRDLFGADFLKRLVPIEPREENGITISGHLARPGEGRPDRDQQFIVLNGRVVQCPAIYQPLREAYSEAIPKGRHPLAVLRVSMDPLAFDCNVHPAKREVRIHRPDLLRQAVFLVARSMLDNLRRPAVPPPQPAALPTAPSGPPTESTPAHRAPVIPAASAAPEMQAFQAPPQGEWSMDQEEERFELIGGLADRWIVMRSGEGLVLLDARGASERILFESLKRETEAGAAPAQRLLLPEVIELPAKDSAWISENLEPLQAAGFLLEPFGGTTFKVEALPACLAANDARTALLDLCESLRASGSLGSRPLVLDALIRSVSSLAAVKSFPFDPVRARQLVRELLRCQLPYASPRGHPTMIQWSFSELERKFSG